MDRLPETGEDVWCCCYGSDIIIPDYEHGETLQECIKRMQKKATVTIGALFDDGWYRYGGYPMIIAPAYWMPMNIPEPPEMEEENE